jgi:hypothetical protein
MIAAVTIPEASLAAKLIWMLEAWTTCFAYRLCQPAGAFSAQPEMPMKIPEIITERRGADFPISKPAAVQ